MHAVIEADDEINKIKGAISSGIDKTSVKLQEYLGIWKRYKLYCYDLYCYIFVLISYHPIWETQKEAFFRRYRTLDPSVSQFDADIQRSVCTHVCVCLCVYACVEVCRVLHVHMCVHMCVLSVYVCICVYKITVIHKHVWVLLDYTYVDLS